MALAMLWAGGFAAARALAGPATTHAHAAALHLGARVAIALVALLPVAATTTLTGLADALAGLRLPALFVDTTVTTARGVQILRDESTRVARARQLRAPGASVVTRLGLFGSFASTVLERGLLRAQRAHLAMSLRGFDGRLPPRRASTLRARDVVTAVLAIAALVLATRTR
ncbi:MAG: energy-coupling factor transporter transmembrane component T [Deltaproteobacteria bacterium]